MDHFSHQKWIYPPHNCGSESTDMYWLSSGQLNNICNLLFKWGKVHIIESKLQDLYGKIWFFYYDHQITFWIFAFKIWGFFKGKLNLVIWNYQLLSLRRFLYGTRLSFLSSPMTARGVWRKCIFNEYPGLFMISDQK